MRVAVTDVTGLIGQRVAKALVADRHEVLGLAPVVSDDAQATLWPDEPAAQADILGDVDSLLAVGLDGTTPPDQVAVYETQVIQAAVAAGVERIVVLSSTDLYRPSVTDRGTATEEAARLPVGDLSPLGRAAHDLEQALHNAAAQAKITVIRVPMILCVDNPQALALVSEMLNSGNVDGLADRMQGIDADDLATVLVSALRAPRAIGYALNLAGPMTAHMDDILAEAQRLYTVLTEFDVTTVNLRPEYRYAAPVVDGSQARKVLPKRADRPLWGNLAELIQCYVAQARAAGVLPPRKFGITPAKQAIQERRTPLAGRVALVTGATQGIGRATALMLSQLGAEVIAVGRNTQAGAELVKQAEDDARYHPIRFLPADLTVLGDIRALADTVAGSVDHLDILINNVGAAYGTRTETVDGIEASFALNTLAPFLLSQLLLPQLKAAQAARVISLNTNAHRMGRPAYDDLQNEIDYTPMKIYARTKLYQAMLSRGMAEQLKDTSIAVHSIHPGSVRTDIETRNGLEAAQTENLGPQAKQRMNSQRDARRQQMISPQEAAAHVVNLAMSDEFDGLTGLYVDEAERVKNIEGAPISVEGWALWETCCQLVGLPDLAAFGSAQKQVALDLAAQNQVNMEAAAE